MNEIINRWARLVQFTGAPAEGAKGIIGLAGPAGVGKDTFANILHRYFAYHWACDRARIRSFADPLYAVVSALTGLPKDRLQDRALKELPFTWEGAPSGLAEWSPRRMLQFLGTEVCRKQISDTFWLDRMRDWIRSHNPQVTIIPDVRFENEANLCDVVIELTRDGIEYANNHPSAMRLPAKCIDWSVRLTPETDYNQLCEDAAVFLAPVE